MIRRQSPRPAAVILVVARQKKPPDQFRPGNLELHFPDDRLASFQGQSGQFQVTDEPGFDKTHLVYLPPSRILDQVVVVVPVHNPDVSARSAEDNVQGVDLGKTSGLIAVNLNLMIGYHVTGQGKVAKKRSPGFDYLAG